MEKENHIFYRTIIILGVLLLGSCNFQLTSELSNLFPKQEEPGALQTQVAETVVAGQTLNAPSPTPRHTPTPRPPRPTRTPTTIFTITPTPTPEALLLDDFSEISGWGIDTAEGYSYGYTKGSYQISVDIPFTTIWSTRQMEIADARLEVEASCTSGPDNGYYGLICRQQIDGYNYYVMVINSNGFYAIGKVVEGTLEFIDEAIDQGDVIHSDNNANLIRGNCIGNNLSLYTNGQKLLEVQDDTFKQGFIGLVAGIRGMGKNLKVIFDNYRVYKPLGE